VWQGLQTVPDLPDQGHDDMVTHQFYPQEVVCSYYSKLLSNKEGKAAYEATPADAMGVHV